MAIQDIKVLVVGVAIGSCGHTAVEVTLAFRKLSEMGANSFGKIISNSMSEHLPSLRECLTRKELYGDSPGGKNYARKQAAFWSNKYNHKIKRRL